MNNTIRGRRMHNAGTLERLGISGDDIERLQLIARMLNNIGERQCNQEMTRETEARLERRESRLLERAKGIATLYGMAVYYQTDPRGWPLYLYRADDPWIKEHDISSCYSTAAHGVCSE